MTKAKAPAKKRTAKKIAEAPVVTPVETAPEYEVGVWVPEPDPVVEAPKPPRIPHPDEGPVMPKYVPTYSPYGGDGLYAADHRLDKDLFVMIRGERYEHVSETEDGRWVYRKS